MASDTMANQAGETTGPRRAAGGSPVAPLRAAAGSPRSTPSSQMLCFRVSGITKIAIRNMTAGTTMG